MKRFTTTKYLLIDYGNTCIKAGIYQNNKLKQKIIDDKNISFKLILKKIKTKLFDKVIFLSSSKQEYQDNILKQIKKHCKNIYIVTGKDFDGLIDLTKIKKNVIIGNDILLSAYYLSVNYKKAAILCLGTVFYLVVTDKNRILSVDLIPNVMFGLDQVSKLTSIPNELIPEVFDKDVGLDTIDAFKSGAKNMMEGYLDLATKRFNISHKNIIVTGGGAYRYKALENKFNFVPYASLKALAILTKYKKW